MLKNHLIVAWRNLVRHKVYSAINVLGLAIGIAFCILSYLFVRHERSFDTFHERADRIYLAYLPSRTSLTTPTILAPTLREHLPEIERVVRYEGPRTMDGTPVKYGSKLFNMSGFYTDPEFFEVFSFPQVAGDLKTALRDPGAVVISREMARMFFGDVDPLGKQLALRLEGKLQDFLVAGVTEVSRNSSLKFDFLLPYQEGRLYQDEPGNECWGCGNDYIFLLLRDQVQAAELEQKITLFFEQFFAEKQAKGESFFGGPDNRLRLLPLEDLYLHGGGGASLQSNPVYAYVLSGIALAVLLIACVNFTNLSLGLSSTRVKEVGMRKVLGATRAHLVRQFWGEAVLLSLLALGLGLALTELFLPVFNDLVQRDLSLDYGAAWPALLGGVLVVGLVTGSYPALVLSAFQPVVALKSRLRLGGKSWFSRGLVIVQFALSIGLIVTALLMAEQLEFLRSIDLGFKAAQVVVIDTGDVGLSHQERGRMLEVYRQTAATHSEKIILVSAGNMSFNKGSKIMSWNDGKREIEADTYTVDYDYAETIGVELVTGRDFSPDFPTDEEDAILVNEALVDLFDWDAPLGRQISLGVHNFFLRGKVVGVVRDFHVKPLHQPLKPAFFRLKHGNGSLQYFLIKIGPEDIPGTLRLLKETWEKSVSGQPFVYTFLDEDVERTFREDERWVAISRYGALLAVFVACLGVFGLSSLAVARRTKEIGIRKVLGASVPSIVGLLGKEFTYLVLAANLIAWPVAYFAMRSWLDDFAYRIDLGPGVFVLGGVLVLVIAWLTLSYQAIRAARANPVEALRYE